MDRDGDFAFALLGLVAIVDSEFLDGRILNLAVGQQEDRIGFQSQGDADARSRTRRALMLDAV
jgi:hypothetical protein